MSQRLIITILASALFLPRLHGQEPFPRNQPHSSTAPTITGNVLNPELARARFEVDQRDEFAIAHGRYLAARRANDQRNLELVAGRITLDVLLASLQHLVEARRDLGGSYNELSALEVRWRIASEYERILDAKLSARIGKVADLCHARADRLQAETELFRARRARPEAPIELDVGEYSLDGFQRLAPVHFEADQANQEVRTRQRVEAASGQVKARREELVAGRITPDVILESFLILLEAQHAAGDDASKVAALELVWKYHRETELILQDKLSNGIAKTADLAECRVNRLKVETALIKARQALPADKPTIVPLFVLDVEIPYLTNADRLARDRFEADETSSKERSKDRYATARFEVERRMQELAAGRITPDVLIRSYQRLLTAQLDLGEKEHLESALETHWRLALAADDAMQAKASAGIAKIADTSLTTETRFGAELMLVRSKKAPKP